LSAEQTSRWKRLSKNSADRAWWRAK